MSQHLIHSLVFASLLATPALATDCEYRAGGDFELSAVQTASGYDVFQWIEGDPELVDRCALATVGQGGEAGVQAVCENAGVAWVLYSGPSYENPRGDDIMVLSNTVFFRVCPDTAALEIGLGN